MDFSSMIPAIVSVALGLIVGGGMAVGLLAKDEAQGATGKAAVLSGRKAALLEQIRDVDSDRVRLGDAAWQTERELLITEASEVLKELDALAGASAVRPSNPLVPPIAFGLVVAIFSVWAVVSWPSETDGRVEEPPPRQMAGGMPHGEGSGMALPEDLVTLNAMTWQAMGEGNLAVAMRANEKARQVAPDDPVALTHRQALRITVGMNEQAKEGLDEVLSRFPDHPHALFWAGLVRAELGQREDAEMLFRRIQQVAPDAQEWAMAQEIMEQMKAGAAMAAEEQAAEPAAP
ncbi:MAG: tetratricopeptide repeat protein [Deltaproteobacteria bacterium]|nr:tetratricopeptide repeat protein [Deltaproteobacteria bacterium]